MSGPSNIMPQGMPMYSGYQQGYQQGPRMQTTPQRPQNTPYSQSPDGRGRTPRRNIKQIPNQAPPPQQPMQMRPQHKPKPKKKASDLVISQKLRELVPESQAYMDLLSFERKLDSTIMRKRLDIQEVLKKPMKQKRKLRIFITNTSYPSQTKSPAGEPTVTPTAEDNQTTWELKIEGRLLDENGQVSQVKADPRTPKRKFSSFFKSLVIELDKEMYGPDNHFVEWHRNAATQETDGFQVKRPGDKRVKCTIHLQLDHQPPNFKLDKRLGRILGIHTATRAVIVNALWQYVKVNGLQDNVHREVINNDIYFKSIFECDQMKFSDIPHKLHPLLEQPVPIVIQHIVEVAPGETKSVAHYDIAVEVDDKLKQQMNNFLLSTTTQQEIMGLDQKIYETVDSIKVLKTKREFMLGFASDSYGFINKWLISQSRDLKTILNLQGDPEEERKAEFYQKDWLKEGVCRYFYAKVQQRRAELERDLGVRQL